MIAFRDMFFLWIALLLTGNISVIVYSFCGEPNGGFRAGTGLKCKISIAFQALAIAATLDSAMLLLFYFINPKASAFQTFLIFTFFGGAFGGISFIIVFFKNRGVFS